MITLGFFFRLEIIFHYINIQLCLINSHNKMNTVILIYHYYKNKCFIIIWNKVPQCSQWNKLTSTSLSVLSYVIPYIHVRVHVLIQQFPMFPMHVKIKIIITHSDRVSYMPKRKKESMRQTKQ